jgi:hypothetical protein
MREAAMVREVLGKAVAPTVLVFRAPPKPTMVFDTYWRFAAERQAIYFRRLARARAPWTTDPILSEYKFTNVYRASDRVSQYLIQRVIYGATYEPQDVVLRVLLFKIFNKIETWELLESQTGPISASNFDVPLLDRTLSEAMHHGARIYSAAYIMPNAPKQVAGSPKHHSHLELLRTLLRSPWMTELLGAPSMRSAFEILLSLPSIGPFLGYQYAVDLNYSECFDFSEDDFVQPGPGALSGLKKCFDSLGDYSPAEAIRWVADRQEAEFSARGIKFQTLWGRRLHLIDCQNLFCEVDKYARVAHPSLSAEAGRTRIKQKFKPTEELPAPFFPPKWKVSVELPKGPRANSGHRHQVQLVPSKRVTRT